MERKQIVLSEKQGEILRVLDNDIHTEIFMGGAAGGSKSFTGCYWQLKRRLKYPGSRGFLARARLKDLKVSTLLTFFEVARMLGLKKGKDYVYNSQMGVITFSNGSEEYLKDLFYYPSDPEFTSLGSTEYTDGFIDEMGDVGEQAYQIIRSRMRFKLDEFGLIPKIAMGSNPCKTFIYKEFYKKWRDNELEHYKAYIKASVYDNPFISEHYIENLKKLDPINRARLLDGNWEYDDDPYKLFDYDKILDLFTNDAERGKRYCIVDAAGNGRDKTVIGIWDGLFVERIIIKDNISSHELDVLLQEYKIPRSQCAVDEGGVGFGLVKDLSGVKGFVANSRPITKKKENETDKVLHNYKNLKCQCWFLLSKYVNNSMIGIDRGISTEARNLLIEDLEHMKQKDPDKDAPLQVTTKDELKEYIGRSTDCFIAGTKVLTNNGYKNIESIKIKDKIITPYGTRKVIRLIKKDTTELYKLTFSDGNTLYTTDNHKIYTKEGFKNTDRLMITDKLDNDNLINIIKWRLKHLLNIKERSIGFREHIDTITTTTKKRYIDKYGKMQINKKSQRDTTFIILIEMFLIIIQKIYKLLIVKNIKESIVLEDYKIKNTQIKERLNLQELENLQRFGINRKKEENGTENIIKRDWEKQKNIIMYAKYVVKTLLQTIKKKHIHAHKPVLTSIEILKLKKKESVYNLTLDKDNVYYANGILVSNCGDMLMMRMYYELSFKFSFDFVSPRKKSVISEETKNKILSDEEERLKQLENVDFGPKRDWIDN